MRVKYKYLAIPITSEEITKEVTIPEWNEDSGWVWDLPKKLSFYRIKTSDYYLCFGDYSVAEAFLNLILRWQFRWEKPQYYVVPQEFSFVIVIRQEELKKLPTSVAGVKFLDAIRKLIFFSKNCWDWDDHFERTWERAKTAVFKI